MNVTTSPVPDPFAVGVDKPGGRAAHPRVRRLRLEVCCGATPVTLTVTPRDVTVSDHRHERTGPDPAPATVGFDGHACELAATNLAFVLAVRSFASLARQWQSAQPESLDALLALTVAAFERPLRVAQNDPGDRAVWWRDEVLTVSRRRHLFLTLVEREHDIVAVRLAGPYPSAAAALIAHAHRLRIVDAYATVSCVPGLVAELPGALTLDEGVESVTVNSRDWTDELSVVFPDPEERYDEVASWDNGGSYSRPGGDITLALRRLGRHYVRFDDRDWDEIWKYLGAFDDEDDAIEAWFEKIPARVRRAVLAERTDPER